MFLSQRSQRLICRAKGNVHEEIGIGVSLKASALGYLRSAVLMEELRIEVLVTLPSWLPPKCPLTAAPFVSEVGTGR